MKGTPDNTVILHWDERQTAWAELPRRDWVRLRGFGEGGASLLAAAVPGLAGAQHGAACWDFLSAIGICHASTRAN